MVRLVVLAVLFPLFLVGCSSLSGMRSTQDPRHHQSEEALNGLGGMGDDLVRLNEGEHHPAVQVLLNQAEEARQQGNNRQALSYLDRAREIQPRNSAIFYRQAWLNFQMGEMQQAEQLLQRATVFLRKSVVNYELLQRRICALQQKVEANRMFNRSY